MHRPVLLEQIIDQLSPSPGDTILDATFGGGGHSRRILEKISPGGQIIGIEKDNLTFERAKSEFNGVKNLSLVNDDFRNIDRIFETFNVREINGALFDLGVSSFQLDEGERGFSFLREGPLDMRFDRFQEHSAKDVVNRFTQEELESLIRGYGEERHAKLVSKAIIRARKEKKIESTIELVKVIERAIGRKYYNQKLHPAARTFQALRVFVNDELGALEEVLDKVLRYMTKGSRLCVISFHSLEDRIVKHKFRSMKKEGNIEIITKKPITPEIDEVRENARARSAKLRVGEKK